MSDAASPAVKLPVGQLLATWPDNQRQQPAGIDVLVDPVKQQLT